MSKYLYGIHNSDGKFHQEIADILQGKGYLISTESIGHDPNDQGSKDYSPWQSAGISVISRLNNGYYPDGSISLPEHYDDFAARCANFVKNCQGCNHFIVANEPNHAIERPSGIPITPQNYVECFNKCYQAIKAVSPDAQVIPAAVAPWNIETGDWLDYFEYVLNNIECSGIAVHCYSHGHDPVLVTSNTKMDAPYQDRYYNFRAYLDFMDRIPDNKKHLPIYITETDANDVWQNVNNGWIQEAYKEIDRWNQSNDQQIHCLAIYRWESDQWAIKDKPNVIDDLKDAIKLNYQWKENNVIVFEDGFENGFYYADDPYSGDQNVSELECPDGWMPDWMQGDSPGINHRPEFKPKIRPQPEVYQGDKAVGIHTTSASHDGVLYHQFNVLIGAKIKASVYAMGKGDGDHGMVVGIDPYGSTDFKNAVNVTYGEWWSWDVPGWNEDEWRKIDCEVIAQADTVTVFLRTVARISNSNAAHFDAFSLESDQDIPIPSEPPLPGDGLQSYIDQVQNALNDLQSYVDETSIRALPI